MQPSASNLTISSLPTNVLGPNFSRKLQTDGLLDRDAESCVFAKMPIPKTTQCCSCDGFFCQSKRFLATQTTKNRMCEDILDASCCFVQHRPLRNKKGSLNISKSSRTVLYVLCELLEMQSSTAFEH